MNLETWIEEAYEIKSTTVEISMNLETDHDSKVEVIIYDSRNFNELGNVAPLFAAALSTTVEISMNLETHAFWGNSSSCFL